MYHYHCSKKYCFKLKWKTFGILISVIHRRAVSRQIVSAFQPNKYQFPEKKVDSQFKAFLPTRLDEFPWLHYLDGKDCVICYFCVNQNKSANLQSCHNKEDASISTDFSNWEKAVTRFPEHQESTSHKTALTYRFAVPQCADALAMTNKQAELTMQSNRQCFLKIIQSLRYLGRQGIALQGDIDEESNFFQLLKLRSIDDHKLGNDWKKQKKYASDDI